MNFNEIATWNTRSLFQCKFQTKCGSPNLVISALWKLRQEAQGHPRLHNETLSLNKYTHKCQFQKLIFLSIIFNHVRGSCIGK